MGRELIIVYTAYENSDTIENMIGALTDMPDEQNWALLESLFEDERYKIRLYYTEVEVMDLAEMSTLGVKEKIERNHRDKNLIERASKKEPVELKDFENSYITFPTGEGYLYMSTCPTSLTRLDLDRFIKENSISAEELIKKLEERAKAAEEHSIKIMNVKLRKIANKMWGDIFYLKTKYIWPKQDVEIKKDLGKVEVSYINVNTEGTIKYKMSPTDVHVPTESISMNEIMKENKDHVWTLKSEGPSTTYNLYEGLLPSQIAMRQKYGKDFLNLPEK